MPTAFSGVAELGLIAGAGMLIAFLCTMTFLPAAITVCRSRDESAEVGFAWGRRADVLLTRWHGPILMGFAALVVLALALAPRLTFDSDPLDTQSPNTEAMRTLRDLMNQPLSNPYSIDILARNVADARTLAAKLRNCRPSRKCSQSTASCPMIRARSSRWLRTRQISSPRRCLPPTGVRPATPSEIRGAAQAALAQINPALHLLPQGDPLDAIAGDLGAIAHAPDNTVLAVNGALTRFLPLRLDHLRTALGARRPLTHRCPRIFAGPAPAGRAGAGRGVAGRHGAQQPGASPVRRRRDARGAQRRRHGGDSGRDQRHHCRCVSLRRCIAAVLAIAAILVVALRRLRDAMLVLAPLLLSANSQCW